MPSSAASSDPEAEWSLDIDALTQREGLTIVETVKQDYDNHVYLVERAGERLILKTITTPDLRRNLEREIAYASLLAALSTSDPGWTLRTSAPRGTGDGWMLREVVDAPALLSEEACDRPDALDRVGRALADLDRLSPDPAARRPAYRDHAGEPVAGEADRMGELERWVREADERGALGGLGADRVVERLCAGRAAVRPGFEVWDVKFDDFLDLPEGRVGVYDLEFAHLFGRRYYDVAKLYGTLAVPFAVPEAAARLLRAFLDTTHVPADVMAEAGLPVLAEALLAELYDASDPDGTEDGAGRVERARTLLDRALSGDLDGLL